MLFMYLQENLHDIREELQTDVCVHESDVITDHRLQTMSRFTLPHKPCLK